MATWQPFKAPSKDRQKNISRSYKPVKQGKRTACRICGKPTEGGKICRSCNNFINDRRNEERTDNK